MEHHSWKKINNDNIIITSDNNIPEYDINEDCYEEMYNNFFNIYGCIIIKNVFCEETMNNYDSWCDNIFDFIKNDKNINHPIQKDKILFNNIIERMGKNNPQLLHKLLNNNKLNNILDCLLGFAKIGSCTGHKVLKGGNKQEMHVDYPIHLNSGSFWKDNGGVNRLKRMITKHQLNNILPHFSLQALTAICDMDKNNGSTEIVPGSHLIDDIDIKLRDENFRKNIEKYFINVKLNKGDVLLFNRRLCHRGGYNKSDKDRNALITQYVWSWGIGQENINCDDFFKYLEENEEEDEMFKLRIKFKYPIDVSMES